MWFVGVEVEQATSTPPPKKILDPPLLFNMTIFWVRENNVLFPEHRNLVHIKR